MTDSLTNRQRSALMARIRSSGNRSTELRLIALLRAHRIRGWRRNWPVRGRPDFVFPSACLAIFVDGEFWHGHPTRCRVPATNRQYWLAKIAGNKVRDRTVNRALRKEGWRVLRIWEHQLSPANALRTIARVCEALSAEACRHR